MGLEPTTFCMARSPRNGSAGDKRRQGAWMHPFPVKPSDPKRHEPTDKAD
jgi:hypothetical protein